MGYHRRNAGPRRGDLCMIRSSNRSARIAERALLAGQRPLLVVARREDPAQEIQFADGRVMECLSTQALFSTRKTSSTWRPHWETPAAASPNYRATDSIPRKLTACTLTHLARPGIAAEARLPIRQASSRNSRPLHRFG